MGEVGDPNIGLIGETFGEEGMNLRRKVLGRRLHEFALVLDRASLLVEEEGGAEVDDF